MLLIQNYILLPLLAFDSPEYQLVILLRLRSLIRHMMMLKFVMRLCFSVHCILDEYLMRIIFPITGIHHNIFVSKYRCFNQAPKCGLFCTFLYIFRNRSRKIAMEPNECHFMTSLNFCEFVPTLSIKIQYVKLSINMDSDIH